VTERAPADELYSLPLEEFTAARDALAARLKAAGQAPAAGTVKKLRKPTVPAWAANQVVRQAPAEWARLRTAAQTLREKQGHTAPAEEIQRAVAEQREALRACEKRAAEWLERHDHAAGPAVVQKVTHTLLALVHGSGEEAGSLEHELQPPGFEAFAGTALPATPETRPRPVARAKPREEAPRDERATELEQARERERAAEKARDAERRRDLARAHQQAERAEKRVSALEEQLVDARRERDEARARVLELEGGITSERSGTSR
jgi:hypothetical protein